MSPARRTPTPLFDTTGHTVPVGAAPAGQYAASSDLRRPWLGPWLAHGPRYHRCHAEPSSRSEDGDHSLDRPGNLRGSDPWEDTEFGGREGRTDLAVADARVQRLREIEAAEPVSVTTARWPGSGPAVSHTRR